MNLKGKNILIVASHLDDIEIGMGETFLELKKNNTIKVIILSSGLLQMKRIDFDKYSARKNITIENFSDVSIEIYSEDIDVNFQDSIFNLRLFLDTVIPLHFPDGPDIIFTQEPDLHTDHKVTNELMQVVGRPDSNTEMFFNFIIPGSSAFKEIHTGSTNGFLFNGFNTWKNKEQLLNKYSSYGILPNDYSIRGVQGIKNANRYWGSIINKKYAEKFKIGFIKGF